VQAGGRHTGGLALQRNLPLTHAAQLARPGERQEVQKQRQHCNAFDAGTDARHNTPTSVTTETQVPKLQLTRDGLHSSGAQRRHYRFLDGEMGRSVSPLAMGWPIVCSPFTVAHSPLTCPLCFHALIPPSIPKPAPCSYRTQARSHR
jgi:hypothetical protein